MDGPKNLDGSKIVEKGSRRKVWPQMTGILLNRTRSRIIRFLVRHGPADAKQIGLHTTLSASTVRYNLGVLSKGGLVLVSLPHPLLGPGSRQFTVDQSAVRRRLLDEVNQTTMDYVME